MKKEERKVNAILYIANGQKICVRNIDDCTVKKVYFQDGVEYEAVNINEKDFFDEEEFWSTCPDIIWDVDIVPILKKWNNIINFTLIVNCERDMRQYSTDEGKYIENNTATSIELRLMVEQGERHLNIKRELFWKGVVCKEKIIDFIGDEIVLIQNEYGFWRKRELVKIDPSFYEIILPAGRGGIYLHEAIGHCLEADLFLQGENVLGGKLGKKLTNNRNISISDVCSTENVVSYKFSDDGSCVKPVNLIEKGYLTGIMTDEFTAKSYGVANTGNGRSADAYVRPIPRMRNTFMHNGSESVEDIIRSTRKGIVATEILGGNVIIQNGSFVFNVAHGLIVENGNIIGITDAFLFNGNIIKSLDAINAIGNDLSFVPAMCSKKGQMVRVSYGQPTIRIDKQR